LLRLLAAQAGQRVALFANIALQCGEARKLLAGS